MVPTELAWGDFESRSNCDVTVHGAFKHARHPSSEPLVLGWSIGQDHGSLWSPAWAWKQEPEPTRLFAHIEAGGYIVFWNAFYDRHFWNSVMVPKYGWPELPLRQVLCAQALAEGNNLPGKLEKAAEMLRTGYQKDRHGKRLISLLSHGSREDWDEGIGAQYMPPFRAYCLKDVLAMRDVWMRCRPLSLEEWDEYHASEEINDRGVMVDAEFARAAAEFAKAEEEDLNDELAELCGEDITITNHVRKAKWLNEQLWPSTELQDVTYKGVNDKGKDRYTADRQTREFLLDALANPDYGDCFEDGHRDRLTRFLEILEAGNSAAVRKFTAIGKYEYLHRVHGQYSFNGAGQTGRYSSRGVQIHNLVRDPVEKGNPNRALDAIEDILAGDNADSLVARYGFPISRLLARLIRPCFMAGPGNTLVWADWDQIEARVLPWLSKSRGGEERLALFRSGTDVYTDTASDLFDKPYGEVEPRERDAGKVIELACGFSGWIGAVNVMARNYGMTFSPDEAKRLVRTWRNKNHWAETFWDQLWDAARTAFKNPGARVPAGRIEYVYQPGLMGGTLVCILPDGRLLTYPQFKREPYVDEHGNQKIRTSFVKGFGSGYGRVDIWRGTFAENVTQATAASFLRRALAELRDIVVLHTHDEIITEVPEALALETADRVLSVMQRGLPWSDGLPLTASVESGPFYTK